MVMTTEEWNGGMVGHLAHYNPNRGAKFHAQVRRSLGVPKMDRKARGQEQRRPGWGRKPQRCGHRPASA